MFPIVWRLNKIENILQNFVMMSPLRLFSESSSEHFRRGSGATKSFEMLQPWYGSDGVRLDDGIYLRTASTKNEEHTLIRQFIRSAVKEQTRILLLRQKEKHWLLKSKLHPTQLSWRLSSWNPSGWIWFKLDTDCDYFAACPPGSRQDILAGSHYTFGQIRLWAQKYKNCSFRDD